MTSLETSTSVIYDEAVEFSHAYQPIVDLSRREVYAYESLVRGPRGESPAHIFNEIPRSSRTAFELQNRAASIRRAMSLCAEPFRLSLNFSISCLISGTEIRQESIDSILEAGASFNDLIIEITEADVIHGVAGLSEAINALRALGATIAIDDFGAGYAGMNSLIEINPDILKLDMFLIRGIEQSGTRQAAVRALFSLAEDLGIDLIAEGVETQAELNFLRDLGVELYQGYLIAKPGFNQLPHITWPD